MRGSKGSGENAPAVIRVVIPTSRAQDSGTPADSSRRITCNRALPVLALEHGVVRLRESARTKPGDQSSAGNQRSRCSQRCSSNSQASIQLEQITAAVICAAVSATTNA